MVTVSDIRPADGYHPEIGLLLAALEDGTREWLTELGDVDEETIVWRPFQGGPSIGAEIMHIAHVEASWIEETVGGRPLSGEFRQRTLADQTDVDTGRWGEPPRMPLGAYREILAEVRTRTREVLLAEKDPARPVQSHPDYWPDSVRWIVSHVVQHESYHGGQAVLLKRLAAESKR